MEQQITDDIMIRLPVAAGPPTSEAIRLGKMEIIYTRTHDIKIHVSLIINQSIDSQFILFLFELLVIVL